MGVDSGVEALSDDTPWRKFTRGWYEGSFGDASVGKGSEENELLFEGFGNS